MKTITIYNNKGGVAKTTTAVNLAYNLTREGKTVLLIDMDPQGNASSFYKKYNVYKKSIKDLLTNTKTDITTVIKRTKFENLHIIPSDLYLAQITAEEMPYSLSTLKERIKPIKYLYDYCIIDCPPGIGNLSFNAIEAADKIIIPIKPTAYAKDGLDTVLAFLRACKKTEYKALITMYAKGKMSLNTIEQILTEYDCDLFDTVIRRSAAVERSEARKRPLAKCATRSPATLDYMDFTKEMLSEEESHGIFE